jgi:thymidylate kinase
MTIELIATLINTLNNENLRYVHWKSNFSLSQGLRGETDLDLLIERRSMSRIMVIMLELGFKNANTKSAPDPNGVFHYYGMDSLTGALIHVHLFSSVLTGESFVKTHLLPIENMLLDNSSKLGAIKVPSRAAELVVFIIRSYIKYGSLIDVLMLANKSAMVLNELNWLQSGNEIKDSLALLKNYCPVIDEGLFLECLKTLNENSYILRRILLAKTVRRRLKIYSKYQQIDLIFAYVHLIWKKLYRLYGTQRKDKVLITGGAVIAFVGAEATGKSTLVSETGKWLRQCFSTRTFHAGKPPSTWVTTPINVSLPILRRLLPQLRTTRQDITNGQSTTIVSNRVPKGWSGLIYAIRSVSLAWDRRQLLVKARYFAANGDFVVCDRYPSENIGTMDSPRLQENYDIEGPIGTLYNWLARLEQRFYKEIPPPDIVIKLKVSMETARQRNRDRIKVDKETDAYLEARHRQCRDWYMFGTKYIFEIDSEQSLANTIIAIKQKIWEVI